MLFSLLAVFASQPLCASEVYGLVIARENLKRCTDGEKFSGVSNDVILSVRMRSVDPGSLSEKAHYSINVRPMVSYRSARIDKDTGVTLEATEYKELGTVTGSEDMELTTEGKTTLKKVVEANYRAQDLNLFYGQRVNNIRDAKVTGGVLVCLEKRLQSEWFSHTVRCQEINLSTAKDSSIIHTLEADPKGESTEAVRFQILHERE